MAGVTGGGKPPPSGADVQKWFQEACARSRKLKVPSIEICSALAEKLPNALHNLGGQAMANPLEDFKKFGKKMLAHLPVARARIEQSLQHRDAGGTDGQAGLLMMLHRMCLIEKNLCELLEPFEGWPTKGKTWHRAAEDIHHWAMEAWLDTDGPMPRAVNETDPLCIFVHQALAALLPDLNLQPEGVSKALRGVTGKPSRKKKKPETRSPNQA